jgi:hypothetical protein
MARDDKDRQMLAPQGPSGPLSRQPVPLVPQKRRRTFGDVLTGLAAFLALAVLVAGVPLALAYFVGWPLPHSMPQGNVLNSKIDTKTFTNVLAILVWVAWAQFSACVLVEVVGAVRGVGMPGHVPLSGGSQLLARQLVAAVLLITASASSFAPGLSSLGRTHDDGPAKAPIAATAMAHAQRGSIDQTPHAVDHSQRSATSIGAHAASSTDSGKTGATKFYRVAPPEGRHHDSLWDIAQRHLGDGRRYQEIFDLNKDRPQPDGSTLTKSSLIRPGWILEMPGDAFGGDLVDNPFAHGASAPGLDTMAARPSAGGDVHADVHTMNVPTQGPHGASAPGLDAASPLTSSSDTIQTATLVAPVGGSGESLRQVADDLARLAQTAGTPRDAAPTILVGAEHQTPMGTPGVLNLKAPTGSDASSLAQSQAAGSQQAPFRLPLELVASPLLAAGLLGALGRNRRRQLWNRAVGRRLTVPGTDAAAAEEAIRLGAGIGEVRFLNQALRELSATLTASGRPLPAVYSARLTEEGLELLLSDPAPEAPAPWTARADARGWFVARSAVGVGGVDAEAVAKAVAPYPGLVTVGVAGQTRVLLDLEAASGVIAVGGDDTMRRAALAAMAVELITNTWSDKMTVTLVGFPGDLTPLAPGRVRQTATLEEVLPALRAELEERRRGLGQFGLDSVLSGRLAGLGGAAWPPHFIISALPVAPDTATRLADLVGGAGRNGVGYLLAGDVPSAAWQATVDAAGWLRAPLLDLEVEAQRLPDDQYAAVLSLFGVTTDLLGVEIPPLTAEAAVLEAQLRVTPTVSVRLLGELEITGGGDLEEERQALVTEALVFLMLHRDGVHPRVLTSALWPRGVTNQVSESVMHRLATWLGTSPEGAPNLVTLPDGRLTVGEAVRSDWEMFTNLRALADRDPRYQDPNNRDQLLGQALGLVRGSLLARRESGRYGWLAYESVEAEVPAVIADTAVELAELRLAAGNPEAAVDAVRSGMRGSPADEELWRALLRATHATGDQRRLADVVESVQRQTQAIHGERGLHPKTEALVDELLPGWRTPAVVGA